MFKGIASSKTILLEIFSSLLKAAFAFVENEGKYSKVVAIIVIDDSIAIIFLIFIFRPP